MLSILLSFSSSLASCLFPGAIALPALSVLLPNSSSVTLWQQWGLKPGFFTGWVCVLPLALEVPCLRWLPEQLSHRFVQPGESSFLNLSFLWPSSSVVPCSEFVLFGCGLYTLF